MSSSMERAREAIREACDLPGSAFTYRDTASERAAYLQAFAEALSPPAPIPAPTEGPAGEEADNV